MYIVNYNYIILYIYICLRIGDTLDLWRTRKGSGSTSDRYRMTQLILFLTLYWRLLGNIQWGCKNGVYSYFSESKPWLLRSFPQKHWSKAKRVLLNCGSYRECITPIKYYNRYCKNPLPVIRCVKSEVDKSIGDVRLPCPQNHVGSEISTTGFP